MKKLLLLSLLFGVCISSHATTWYHPPRWWNQYPMHRNHKRPLSRLRHGNGVRLQPSIPDARLVGHWAKFRRGDTIQFADPATNTIALLHGRTEWRTRNRLECASRWNLPPSESWSLGRRQLHPASSLPGRRIHDHRPERGKLPHSTAHRIGQPHDSQRHSGCLRSPRRAGHQLCPTFLHRDYAAR